jgi:predicted ATP-grasp superfamily ATP-dependent carboligase
MQVIVLDGNQRSALATVRALGRKGIVVSAGEDTAHFLSSGSRYCSYPFVYPSVYTNPDGFIETIRNFLAQRRGAVLLPMTDVTVCEVLKHKGELSKCAKIPFVDYGTPMPKTLFSGDFPGLDHLFTECAGVGFPLVLKPAGSRIRTARGWLSASVRYVSNQSEFEAILHDEAFRVHPFLIQEKIDGPGMGIFLLMHEGKVVAKFAHQRVREKPPSGGVSVLCKSINPPPEALEAAAKLLEALEWSGVAMVEFKLDNRDNRPKLMEINGRFWGSLQLAISAGVDFPYLLFAVANGERISPSDSYKIGLKSRWELGDFDHLLIRLRTKPSESLLGHDKGSKLRVLRTFLTDFFKPSVRNEVFRPEDPFPFFLELRQYVKAMLS